MPIWQSEICGKRYIGSSCPFCTHSQVGRRRSIDNSGFGSLSSMFVDVERSGDQINVSGNLSVHQTTVSGDMISGDYVDGDKVGGDIDNGPSS